jgi:hypothetical protein
LQFSSKGSEEKKSEEKLRREIVDEDDIADALFEEREIPDEELVSEENLSKISRCFAFMEEKALSFGKPVWGTVHNQ